MQMQDLSYVLNNQKIGVDSYQVSVEVFSLENIYRDPALPAAGSRCTGCSTGSQQ